jgi:TolB-like protein
MDGDGQSGHLWRRHPRALKPGSSTRGRMPVGTSHMRRAIRNGGIAFALLSAALVLSGPAPLHAQTVTSGLETLAGTMGPKLVASGPLTLAIADFPTLRGDYCALGRYAAERLTTQLSSVAQLKVIERSLLAQALEEMKFSMADLADPEKAKQVGLRLGAEAIMLGAISNLSNTVELDTRVFRVATGDVLFAGYTSFANSQGVDTLFRQDCGQVASAAEGSTLSGASSIGGEQAAAVAMTPTGPALATYENGTYRIVIEAGRRSDTGLTLVMTLEDVTDKPIKVALRSNAYLVDENGERWNQSDSDSAGYWAWGREFSLNDLIPKTKRRTRILFKPAGSGRAATRGEIFSLIGTEYRPMEGRVLTIPNIRVPVPPPAPAPASTPGPVPSSGPSAASAPAPSAAPGTLPQ